jgi:DNA-binding transcriptional regulator YiaG
MSRYLYSECGLENVLIEDLETVTDDAGEETYCIRNVMGLHKVLAYCVVTRKHGVTPDELRFLRTEMGMTQAELAQLVKKDHQTIGRWERGETPIDQNAEAVIRILAAERLEIDMNLTVEEIAKRCVPTATVEQIVIDGHDPSHYEPKMAA